MTITAKQEKFAQCVSDGMSQADAYRASFEVNPSTKPETVQANASRLMANSMVAARVMELREALAEKALWTREDSIRALSRIASGGDDEAKPSDRVAAVKAINTMHGWDAPQKIDHTSSDGSMTPKAPTEMTDEQLEAFIARANKRS